MSSTTSTPSSASVNLPASLASASSTSLASPSTPILTPASPSPSSSAPPQPTAAPAPRIPPRWHWALVPALLLVFFLFATCASRTQAPTFDEPVHLAGGWSYWKTWDFRINPEHPPLMKQWAALPLLPLSLGRPADYRGWDIPDGKNTYTHYFFFSGNDFERIFRRAHLAMGLLSVLLGLWIYLWARRLWGGDGALFSLALFAFSPNLLAHAPLVHTDYNYASFAVLSLFLWARLLCRPTLPRTLAAAVASALALLSKFSALTLVPLWLSWLALALLTHGRWPACLMEPGRPAPGAPGAPACLEPFVNPWRPRSLGFWLGRLALFVGIVALLACADYGFHLKPLWIGLSRFTEHQKLGHHAWLHGRVSDSGFWNYFLVAYLIKTPLPELILPGLVLASWLRERRGWAPWALLALPWLYIFAPACLGRVDIGYRHILPLVPLGMVMAGALVSRRPPLPSATSSAPAAVASLSPPSAARRRRLWRLGLGLLLCWQAFGGLFNYPLYLTYFNELVGGSRNGWRWLSDSNVDWGQGLKALSGFMRQSRLPNINLAYFGTCDVARYGIRYRRLSGYNCLIGPIWKFDPDHPPRGVYALFVTNLGGQYLVDDQYRWFRQHEPDYHLANSVLIYYVREGPVGGWQPEHP